jgi:hypothetical protein
MLLYHGFENNVEGATVYPHLPSFPNNIVLDIIGVNGIGRRHSVSVGEIVIFSGVKYKVDEIFFLQVPPVKPHPLGLFLGRAVVNVSPV